MAIQISDNIASASRTANLDAKFGPYTSKQDVIDHLVADGSDIQAVNGLTVGVIEDNNVVEYVFKNIPDNPTAANVTVSNLFPKQAASVEVDSEPEEDSPNPVSSGGVYTALQGKANTSDIPSVPAISTNIESDASSDTKTASPKAVKTYVDGKVSSAYKAAGTASSVANLGSLDASHEGFVYNMSAEFTTTSDFVEGSGKTYPAGTNVAIVNVGTTQNPSYKYDVMFGFVDLSGKADKSEMSVTDGTGTDADKVTIQLKSNTSATVLKQHQDISGKQDTISDLQQIRTRADEGHTALQPKQSGQYTQGDIVIFDANGGLADSQKKTTDFAPIAQAVPTPQSGDEDKILGYETQGGVQWVTRPQNGQDGANGKSAYDLYFDGGGTLTQEQWLASLKANIGAFKFVANVPAVEQAFEDAITGGIGTIYTQSIDNISAGQDTLSLILLMNTVNASPAKTYMIATQDDGSSGFEFIYAGDLQSAMSSNVVTEDSSSYINLQKSFNRLNKVAIKRESINLYNKDDEHIVGYINPQGTILADGEASNSRVSPLIPIKPNTVYAYSIIGASANNCYCRFVMADGITQVKPLNPNTSEEISYASTYPSKLLKSPSNAAYVQFTVNFNGSDISDYLQLVETDELPTTYYPYSIEMKYSDLPTQLIEELNDKANVATVEDVIEDMGKMQAELDMKAEYKRIQGKNLFNPANAIKDKRMDYSTSSYPFIVNSTNSLISGYIEVEEGKTYTYHKGDITGTGSSRSARGIGGFTENYTPIALVNPLTDENYTPGKQEDFIGDNFTFKVPTGCKYICFCLMWTPATNPPELIDYGYQLEEGDNYTGYEGYWEKNIIDYEHLPNEVEETVETTVPDLVDRVETLENNSSIEIISITNSEKIGFFSNSFLNGYCMLNHHAINNMSMFSDYIMYNYGHSGDDILELLGRIDSNSTWLGTVPVRDWNIKYGIIAMQDNDGALYAANADTYYQNSKKMAEAIKSMGGIPILSTEHDWNKYYYAFNRLNNEKGYMYMRWGLKAEVFSKNKFAQMWYNGHPATRTAWLWSYGMQPYLDTLPRPKKSIKLFRVRNTSDLSDLQNLVYNTYLDRAERFIELTCGVTALTEASDKYFDRLDLGLATVSNIQDEYQKIQTGTSVDFGNAALIEVITPYDRNNLKSFKVDITSTGTISHAYCKKVNGLVNPLPSKRYYSFGITSGANLLNIGDSITISGITRADGVDLNRTFIISGIINDMLVTTTTSSPSQDWTNGKTSGTDEPTCNISGVVLHGSYDYPDAAYMERYNKPLGEWTEVVINNGTIELTQAQIKDFTDFDKVAILLVGTGIGITDIQATVAGNLVKNESQKRLIESENGTSILINTTFTSSDTAWVGIENLTDYIRITDVNNANPEVLPMGFTNIKIMNEGDSVYQAVDTTGLLVTNQLKPKKLQLKVIARYFPKYIKTDTDWETTELNRNTLDVAKLKVYLAETGTSTNPTPIAEIPVGAWWNEFVVDVDYAGTGQYLKLECTSKSIQIGKCDLVKLDN